MTRTIKGVSYEKWTKLKNLATKEGVSMGNMLENMIDEYSKNADNMWKKILSGEKIISDSDARELLSFVKEFRKERGFRT